MPETKDNTTISQMDISIDELLGTPGGDNIMIPTEDDKQPTVFSRSNKDYDKFLDNIKDEKTTLSDDKVEPLTPAQVNKEIDEVIQLDSDSKLNDEATEESNKKSGGRPNGLVELGTKLIEKGYLTPFEGEEDISKYTLKDWEELFDSNEKEKQKKMSIEASKEFYEQLPEELKVAAHYFANGGTDLKSLFRSLAGVEEIRQLDISDEQSQEQIIRSYLHATQFGDADEIEEEIEAWKDRDELEAKAKKFKPKLDAMQEQIVARQLQQQEAKRKQQEKQAALYTDNIYKTLEPGEINGIKIDKKIQNMLFAGLTQPNYPSVSGKPTNLLGHLLEKYQYVEPNHSLITEALWLLADPEGYKAKVKAVGGKEQVEKTVRMLKTEQSNKIVSTGTEDDDNASRKKSTTGITRPSNGFFQRNK